MKIKIFDKEYAIESITRLNENLLKIEFSLEIPTQYGDIVTYTIGGVESGVIKGYDTLYKQDGQIVYLSNDGSVYVKLEPIPPYEPTIDELKESKKQEFSSTCNQTIESGQDILLSNGTTDHFTYKYFDQTNIKNAFDVAKDLKLLGHEDMEIPFYDSDNNCKKYPIEDIITIYMSMQAYITRMTTLCHQLQAMVKDSENKEFIQNLTFEEENLTGIYLDTFNDMIQQSMSIISVLGA